MRFFAGTLSVALIWCFEDAVAHSWKSGVNISWAAAKSDVFRKSQNKPEGIRISITWHWKCYSTPALIGGALRVESTFKSKVPRCLSSKISLRTQMWRDTTIDIKVNFPEGRANNTYIKWVREAVLWLYFIWKLKPGRVLRQKYIIKKYLSHLVGKYFRTSRSIHNK